MSPFPSNPRRVPRHVEFAMRVMWMAALLVVARGAGAAPAAPAAGENVVAAEVDEVAVERPAHRLLDVKVVPGSEGTRVDIVTDGEVGKYELLELRDPARLAFDLHGVTRAPRGVRTRTGRDVRGVRVGEHEGKVRVVLDGPAASTMPRYQVTRTPRGLSVALGSAPAAPAPAVAEVGAPAPAGPARGARVTDVKFSQGEDGQLVRVALSRAATWQVSRPDASTAVLTLEGAELPRTLQRSLDATAFEGVVRTVSSFVDRSGRVQVVVSLTGPAADRVEEGGGALSWIFTPAEVSEAGGPTATAGFSTEAPAYAVSSTRTATRYKGRRVSFEFKDIDIHNLLRVIAEVSKRNIVVSDDVAGKITIRLRNVPWDQALDLILKTKSLGMEESGNIIRIAPLKQLEAEAKSRAAAREEMEKGQPLKVRIIPVNYALAKEIEPKVKDLLSKRGTISVDERTNTLIVKDITEVLSRSEGLVRTLDSQTPQVLIASRIVEATSNFSRDIGVQWGGNLSATSATGNATGLVFPNQLEARGGAGNFAGGLGVPANPNWAVSFPASTAVNNGSAIGFQVGSAGGAAVLNMRLSALESQGTLKTVSAPKVTTLDNKEAVIGQGVSIPFSQVSAAGVNTVFVEAKLELKVTPHVTSDGSILLKIKATNNQPNSQLTGANGQPSITKREAETEVLVADGDTTVIGGIYTRGTTNQRSQVPFLGSIPVLGFLFRQNVSTDDRSELLIFISPTIVNREASVVAGG